MNGDTLLLNPNTGVIKTLDEWTEEGLTTENIELIEVDENMEIIE